MNFTLFNMKKNKKLTLWHKYCNLYDKKLLYLQIECF